MNIKELIIPERVIRTLYRNKLSVRLYRIKMQAEEFKHSDSDYTQTFNVLFCILPYLFNELQIQYRGHFLSETT